MKKGFTLIELLVVIGIIAILASIITISTSSARKQSRDAKRKADLNSVSGALEMYYAQQRSYPNVNYDGLSSYLSPYLSTIPSDPGGGSSAYTYTGNSAQTQYVLDADLELDTASDFAPCPTTGQANYFKTGTCCDSSGKNCHYRVSNK